MLSPASPMISCVAFLKAEAGYCPESVRGYFEPHFGHDFSQVRVHTDTQAAESAWAVNTRL